MKKTIVLLLMSIFILSACSNERPSNDIDKSEHSEKINISASTYPMYYIANEIGKDNIDLKVLVPMGVDPHEYELSLKETKELEDTDLFLYNGQGLEHWGEKVSKNMKDKDKEVINASDYVDLLDIEKNEEVKDEHGHDHGDKDPHIWLNPINVDKIAKELTSKLKTMDNKNSDIYEENYLDLSSRLKALDDKYNEELKNRKQNTILVSHMAFAYLADRYDLNQIAVTGISPQAEPSPKSISRLIDITQEKDIHHIFFEVLSSPKSVEMIADEANLEVLELNPIGGVTKEQFESGDDYIDIMEGNLENLKKALVD